MRNKINDGGTRLIENAKTKAIDGDSGAVPQGEYDAHELLRTLVSFDPTLVLCLDSLNPTSSESATCFSPVRSAHVPSDFRFSVGCSVTFFSFYGVTVE